MNRRTAAGLLAFGLIVVLTVVAATRPVPWVDYRPGPTLNVLGEYADEPIITVTGRKSYATDSSLRMTTVVPSGPDTKVNLFRAMLSWVDPEDALLPRDAVYRKDETREQVRQQSAAQMTSSQDASTAAALTALGIDYKTEAALGITAVTEGGASDGKLKPGDKLVAVAGETADTTAGFIDLVRAVPPGTALPVTVLRDGKRTTVSVTTKADAEVPTRSLINVSLAPTPELTLILPFQIDFKLSDRVGGPSAGMMFALAIYDLLTPGSLSGGATVAGTGEISPEGIIGPIGGIAQKLAGAERDGAKLFLAPEENCAVAAAAHYDREKMRVVRVHTLQEAIDAVKAFAENPDADLPRCTA